MSRKIRHIIENQNDSLVKFAFRILLVFLLISGMPSASSAQDKPNPTISFSVAQCFLDQALDQLYANFHINVAFSKAELSSIMIPFYKAENQTIESVLEGLLQNTGYTFIKVGGQYVIRKVSSKPTPKSDEPTQPSVPQPNTPKPPKTIPPVKLELPDSLRLLVPDTIQQVVPDTIRIVDTIVKTQYVYDTLRLRDTVVQHDTIRTFAIRRFRFGATNFKGNGWFLSASLTNGESFLSTVQSDGSDYAMLHDSAVQLLPSFFNDVEIAAGYTPNRLSISLGLSYRSASCRFLLDRKISKGDCYVYDTAETYYVVHDGDTSLFAILDSTYVTKEEFTYAYRDINTMRYVGVNLTMSYIFFRNSFTRVYLKGSVASDFLLSASGSVLDMEEPYHNSSLKQVSAPIVFSYYAGLGASARISKNSEFLAELGFRRSLSSCYSSDYPLDIRMSCPSLKIGFNYYF